MKTITRIDYKMTLATNTDYMGISTINVSVKNETEFKDLIDGFHKLGWSVLDSDSRTGNVYTDNDALSLATQIGVILWKKNADMSGDINAVRKGAI